MSGEKGAIVNEYILRWEATIYIDGFSMCKSLAVHGMPSFWERKVAVPKPV